jgi:hypothetical protein
MVCSNSGYWFGVEIRVRRSSTPDGLDDLYPVAWGEVLLLETAARDQLLVHLDGETLIAQIKQFDQVAQAGMVWNLTFRAVDEDLHLGLPRLRVKWIE